MKQNFRIALILETSGGGSGRHVLDLARGLAARGHEVTVIWSPERAQKGFVDELKLVPGVQNQELPMSRAVTPRDLSDVIALKRLLAQQKPFDILHAHSSKAGALVRLLPQSIPGHRVYTPHAFRTMDPTLNQPQRGIYGIVERILAPRSSAIIAVSSAEARHAEDLGIHPKRIRVVVNGTALPAEASRAKAREAMGLEDQDVAIGFIGRLEPQKDPLRFVNAVNRAAESASHIRGIVIGDGGLRHEMEQADTAKALNFMGWQDAPALIAGFDVLCMTSAYEAMPYTLIEALHGGVPIVTTAVGGASETVEEGKNGFILPVTCEAEEIGVALASLAKDGEMRQRFAAHSQELAKQRTLDIMIEETLAVYAGAGQAGKSHGLDAKPADPVA